MLQKREEGFSRSRCRKCQQAVLAAAHTHTHVHAHTHTNRSVSHTHKCTHTGVSNMHTRVHARTHTRARTHTHTRTGVCHTHTYTNVYSGVSNMHTCIHARTHTHTHTRTHTHTCWEGGRHARASHGAFARDASGVAPAAPPKGLVVHKHGGTAAVIVALQKERKLAVIVFAPSQLHTHTHNMEKRATMS